jgi:triacylglycerol esterase/lipase EstA (alpha/beta hydrolase family)
LDKAISGTILGVIVAFNPILLIHGYAEDSSVWHSWENWLHTDNFTNVYPITFKHDDECGSVKYHATELSGIVDKILNDTGSERVNIVGIVRAVSMLGGT